MSGWVKLFNATKWHYFSTDGRSLCGRWMIFSLPPVTDQIDGARDNCKACEKLRNNV